MKRVNYHLTENQIRKLKSLSKTTGLKVAELIRRAIDEYFRKKKILCLAMVGVLALAVAGQAEDRTPLTILCLSGSALIFADTLLTFDAIKNWNCGESNPLWRPIIHRPALVLTIDLGICAGMTWGVHKIWKKDKVLAYMLVIAVNAIQLYYMYRHWEVRR